MDHVERGSTLPATGSLRSILNFYGQNPGFGLLGTIASIVGVPLAIYLSNPRPDISCYVNPARAAVVRQGATSRLGIQFDGKPITGDVTATQLLFWNEGRAPVHSHAIRRPITVRTVPKTPILEATLRKTSSDVVRVVLDQSRLSAGQLALSWDLLEPQDAFVVQLVHAGDNNVSFIVDGAFEGQRSVRLVQGGGELLYVPDWLAVVVAVGLALLCLLEMTLLKRMRGLLRWNDYSVIIMATITLATATSCVWVLYTFATGLHPPFLFE